MLRDVRCVLKGSTPLIDTPWGISSWWTLCCGTDAVFLREVSFRIDTPWGISSWLTLCCGTDAVFSREVFFEQTLIGASPHGGRCVVNRTLCSRGLFLNRHSLGHLLIVDALLSLGNLFMADAVLWDGRCVLKGSILE